MRAAAGPGESDRGERVARSRGDQLSPLTEMATLSVLVALLRPLFHDDFCVTLHTQKTAGMLPQKRALFLYKVLGEVASTVSRKFISGNTVGRVPCAIDLARFARPTTAHEFMRHDTSRYAKPKMAVLCPWVSAWTMSGWRSVAFSMSPSRM